ncbi:MAG: hypothetical protein WCW17_02650 [Patescibacteria group bacterium]|jgi:hypothetical protein
MIKEGIVCILVKGPDAREVERARLVPECPECSLLDFHVISPEHGFVEKWHVRAHEVRVDASSQTIVGLMVRDAPYLPEDRPEGWKPTTYIAIFTRYGVELEYYLDKKQLKITKCVKIPLLSE